jgi:tRNA threonylcarbamoyladenosine biosynthesis protein TsaB
MSLILGIDTSGTAGSVALCRDQTLLAQVALEQSGRRHAQTLVAQIAALLKEQSLSPRNLDAVAATRGPGSFTGLRVGVVCAKTLAYALGVPLILVDTFDAIAAQCPPEWNAVWIVDDAQRQELYAGRYVRGNDSRWSLVASRTIHPGRGWLATLSPDDIVIGPGVVKLPSDISSPRIVRTADATIPRAETVCRLARRRLEAGETDDVWTASPFYIRVSGAEENAAARESSRGVAPPRSDGAQPVGF